MSQQISGRLLAAGAVLAVAVLLFGTTLVGALSEPLIEPAPIRVTPVLKDNAPPEPETLSMQAVNEAVAIDPFSPDREPSAEPYKLPTDPEPEPPPPPPPAAPPLPTFRLVGTTQTPTGGVALIQLENGAPRVVALGESYNGFVVQRIDAQSAVLAQGDRSMTLQLQQPSQRATSQPPGRGGRAPGMGPVNGRGGQADNAAQKQMMQQLQEMVRGERTVTVDRVPVRALPRPDTTRSERNPRDDR